MILLTSPMKKNKEKEGEVVDTKKI